VTTERFVELLVMLRHRFPTVYTGRLQRALRAVVDATGVAGEAALEQFCKDEFRRDGSEPPPTG
jgi:hypothetical protein